MEIRYYDRQGFKHFAEVDEFKFIEMLSRMIKRNKGQGSPLLQHYIGQALIYCSDLPDDQVIKLEVWGGK